MKHRQKFYYIVDTVDWSTAAVKQRAFSTKAKDKK
jgi:hypothetical protein